MKSNLSVLALISAFLAILSLTSCDNSRTEEALLARVNQYWGALLLNDIRTLYELEAGSVDGTLTPMQAYAMFQTGVYINSFSVKEVHIDGDTASVEVNRAYTFDDLNGKEVSGVTSDHWIYIKDQWWHDTGFVPAKNPLLSPQ